MPLDQDIATADALALDRIKAQDWRDDARLRRENAAKQTQTGVDYSKQFASMVDKSINDFVGELIVHLAPNYMKPNAATTPDGMAAETAKDAAFFEEALRAVIAIHKRLTP